MELKLKDDGTDAKLWIIGDSFTGMLGWDQAWQYKLYTNFVGKHMYVSSRGSRDTQTIFDIFLKNLHKIKPNDFVILFFPTLSRFRLPLETPYIDVEWSSNRDEDIEVEDNMNNMIGNSAYSSNVNEIAPVGQEELHKKQFTLEWPLNHMPPHIFQPNPSDETPNFGNITQMIHASKAYADNWNVILKSIQQYVPFELIYCSWANELDSSVVNTKNVIKNQCGIWYTLHDEFMETNGEFGKKDDIHWSNKMSDVFSKYIMKSYPQYFNYESKTI